MKKVVFALIAVLATSCYHGIIDRQAVETSVRRQMEEFPESRLQDLYSPDIPKLNEDRKTLDSLLRSGHYAYHHSNEYRKAYHPHYRIIKKNSLIV